MSLNAPNYAHRRLVLPVTASTLTPHSKDAHPTGSVILTYFGQLINYASGGYPARSIFKSANSVRALVYNGLITNDSQPSVNSNPLNKRQTFVQNTSKTMPQTYQD